ncbi:histidine ammonia-lyase [Paeniglutamicibacter psychrophenolicus]|uniref:Histidine ammonia-lyase n=1 Tax=Paeniglutamicibacter psychrophenolicus TaxID=257454 RepID=A0ABS4WK51_9MICC|nr:histidine ammonia-lyase [Paeniglutamicibacter psychrophenolicus]MBP2376343.1 histidine ammonia-lyase [Paeniglutamicibacter psychrophenolicus]
MTTAVLPETAPVRIGIHRTTLEDLIQVARHRRPVVIDEAVFEVMEPSRNWLQGVVDSMGPGKDTPPIYSINTGFGSLAGRRAFAEPADAAELSRRLVLSNAAGVGRYVDEEVVRATMLIRIVSLTQGFSGIRPEIVTTLVDMLNAGVCPAIPEYGSLGASGDLIPLAHVAIVMSRPHTGEDIELDSGEAMLEGKVVSGIKAMAAAGIERLPLGAKDGLALLNGTSFSAAQAALALYDAQNLLETAQITAAMSIEALMGFGDAFIDELHQARGQRGQIEVAARIRELLAGSTLIDGNATTDPVRQPPQDAYSLRCVPQVFGPIKDTLAFAAGILENEINAATDNPLIFPSLPDTRKLKAVSGGNFHAEYVAFAADFISIAVTEIGSITERRLFRLDDGTLNRGLPDMLIDSEQTGMDCGYMLPQYLAAALVSDCKTLAHPDSVDSIPTCANQEDHVSMANNAGRHTRQIVANIESVVGIELLMAAQALELRLGLEATADARLSPAAAAALALVRGTSSDDGRPIDHIRADVVMYPRIRKALELVHDGTVVDTVNQALAG